MNKPIIIAAGGLVLNESKELLMIFRRGKWDLPKGKLDEGESIAECAVREVKEETGLKTVTLGNAIGITKHEYFDAYMDKEVVKESHWYEMFASENETLIAQSEEDITAIEWVNLANINDKLSNSYSTIIEIIYTYQEKTTNFK